MDLISKLENKDLKAEDIALLCEEKTDLIIIVVDALKHSKPHVKYPSGKALIMLSEAEPELIYPYFTKIKEYLNGHGNILKWNAMLIVANLTAVDEKGLFNEKLLSSYFNFLTDESMVTTGNTVKSLGIVALHKKQFREKIITKLLMLDETEYDKECKAIIAGHTITVLGSLYQHSKQKEAMMNFARDHEKSHRKGTAKKAQKFLKNTLNH